MKEVTITEDGEGPYLPEKAQKNSKQFRRIEIGIFLSGLSVFAQLYLFQPMLSSLCKEFLITPAKSSWAVSSCTIGMAIGLFFLAFKADELPRKKLMVFSLLASSVLTIISGLVPGFYLLILLNLVKGILLAGVSSVALAYLSEEVDIKYLGFAIGLYLSGNTLGGMSGRVIAALLSGWVGWRGATIGIGICSLIFGLLFLWLLPESRYFNPQKSSIKMKIGQMGRFMKEGMMIRLYCVAALVMGSFVSIYNYLGFRLEAPPFSLPHYVIAFIFLMYIMGVAGSMVIGKWSDSYRPSQLIKLSTLLLVLGLLLMFAANLFLVILGLGIFTFSFFATHTLASRMVSQHAKEGKSTATSIYWLFYYLGSSFIGTGTGVIYYHGGWYILIISLLLLTLLSFVLSAKLVRNKH